MSDTPMTHDLLRVRHIERHGGNSGYCACCDTYWTHTQPEQHRPGCPCDPTNVVVGREVLASIAEDGGMCRCGDAHRWCRLCGHVWYPPETPRHYDTCPLYVEPAP